MFSIPASGIFSTLNESSSIRHLSPLSTIGSFLVLTDPKFPRRIHPKSTYTIFDDDINHRLSLRLINKAFAKWTIKWVFQRLTFREFVSDIREIKFQNIRRLLEIAATHSFNFNLFWCQYCIFDCTSKILVTKHSYTYCNAQQYYECTWNGKCIEKFFYFYFYFLLLFLFLLLKLLMLELFLL